MNLTDFESEYSALFSAIRKIVPPSMKIYLVGGAVRDILLGRKIRDFDFTVEGLVRPIGKHIANALGGAYYVLDDEREMVRVIIDDAEMGAFDVDIALLTGETIEEDLRDRDFTFNAMAIELGEPPRLIDPLSGLNALQSKTLHMCSPESLENDPMRGLRAIRMSLEFGLTMDDELVQAMHAVSDRLAESSMERYRDELFKIIRLWKNADALRLFQQFGFISHLFPGWKSEENGFEPQWIDDADRFSRMTGYAPNETLSLDDFDRFSASRLGNYREAICGFLEKPLALYHTRRLLMGFTALAGTLAQLDETLVKKWCIRFTFSGSETNFVLQTLQAYRWLLVRENLSGIGDVEIYRYFRKFKEGGISGVILYLADKYSEQDVPEAYKHWCDRVVLSQNLVAAYFTRYRDVIEPQPLMSGTDIQNLLDVPAGPVIGYTKNALIEAQIRGAVKTVEEAQYFVRQQAKHYN